jgi:hypothetical protein
MRLLPKTLIELPKTLPKALRKLPKIFIKLPKNGGLKNIAKITEKIALKVMMVEETEYDDGIECHHSYDKKCHTTYTTDYEPQQVLESLL